jgi:hypothetical protein
MKARRVNWENESFCVKGNVSIPDLSAMSRIDALIWLNRNTYRRGYSRVTNPLAGIGNAISLK